MRIALLGLWSGGMLAFGLLFLPAAFLNLPTPMAAAVLGAALHWLDLAGLTLAGLALAAGLLGGRPRGVFAWALVLIPALGLACHALSYGVVSPQLHALRLAGGGSIGGLKLDDPEMERFVQLHQLARSLFWLSLLCALAALALALRPVARAVDFSGSGVENA